MQKAALQVFPSLAPLRHESLWADYLGCLLRLLRPSQLQPSIEEALEPGTKPSARDLKRWATSSLLMESALHLLMDLFRWSCGCGCLALLVGRWRLFLKLTAGAGSRCPGSRGLPTWRCW